MGRGGAGPTLQPYGSPVASAPEGAPAPSRRCLRSSSGRAPYASIPDDPLPERASLVDLANQMAEGKAPLPPNVTLHVRRGVSVEELRGTQGEAGVRVVGQSEAGPFDLEVEVAVAHVGFRPDLSLSRELQANPAPHRTSPHLAFAPPLCTSSLHLPSAPRLAPRRRARCRVGRDVSGDPWPCVAGARLLRE